MWEVTLPFVASIQCSNAQNNDAEDEMFKCNIVNVINAHVCSKYKDAI